MIPILDMEELKSIEFEALKAFVEFCEENHLRYFLAYGTLLGAVRHGGFIPWDDDIDVIMPRPDYTKFLELTSKAMGQNYRVISSLNEPDTIYPFAKVIDIRTKVVETSIRVDYPLGVWVDVFPMDGIPDEEKDIVRHFRKMKFYQYLLYLSVAKIVKGKSTRMFFLKFILIPPARLFNYRSILRKYERKAQKYDFDGCNDAAVGVSVYGIKEVVKKADYIQPIKLMFENELFNVPANYHEHLSKIYGNYMQPPPKDERVSNHALKAYWK